MQSKCYDIHFSFFSLSFPLRFTLSFALIHSHPTSQPTVSVYIGPLSIFASARFHCHLISLFERIVYCEPYACNAIEAVSIAARIHENIHTHTHHSKLKQIFNFVNKFVHECHCFAIGRATKRPLEKEFGKYGVV